MPGRMQGAVDVVVRDGSTVRVRQAGGGDVGDLRRFLQSLSPQSLFLRFHGHPALTESQVRALVDLDGRPAATLVAESGGRIVACAGFAGDADDPTRAEIALAVADALQGHGIGTRLLEQLAAVARGRGIDTFDALVLGENRAMLEVFRHSGFAETVAFADGAWHVRLTIAPTAAFAAQAAARARAAATSSMRAFFEPRVVAVIGANRTRGKIGAEILHNLRDAGFTGTIVPVHPTAAEIEGLPCRPRVTDVPGAVDLAVVAVPADRVLDAVDDCIAKHVPAICVISAGFSECGPEGREREARLVEAVRRAGCRLVGPNCMGLLNTSEAVRLNATFSPVYPPRGRVAMSTQSGALGLAILDYARRLDIGISSFVSVGNKADVSSNDLLQYWAGDPHTAVILLYLESFGNPRKFAEIARAVGRAKPIVAVKAGRSAAGARAAASHTGALASNDAVVTALFRQSGIIRAERLEEMFDVAALLSHQPLPKGPRVAILTNAGGPGILAADACEANGLQLPPLGEATRAALRAFLPGAASVHNPVDMLASAPAEHFERALTVLLDDAAVDSVIAIFIPPLVTQPEAAATALAAAAAGRAGKPVLGVFMRAEGAPSALAGIPSYAFPESAALALARVTAYAQWRGTPVASDAEPANLDRQAMRRIVDAILARGGGWGRPDENEALLAAAGITCAPSAVVTGVEAASDAAARLGFPVVLKALGPTLLHKTERQAVMLNLGDDPALRAAYADVEARLGHEMTAALVQRMAPPGVEMIAGVILDPMFGPLIACGTGGILVDVLADVSFRLHPVSSADAAAMVGELRGARLLRGFRGAPPADEAALCDVLRRLSALVAAVPEIQELDLNPVVVHQTGACVADVRIRLGPAVPPAPSRRVEY